MNLEQFINASHEKWGSPVEIERRNRILVALAAYAYEIMNDPIMSDDAFDKLALTINLKIKTGNAKMDKFFKKEFETDTGQWIHKHPELSKLKFIFSKLKTTV